MNFNRPIYDHTCAEFPRRTCKACDYHDPGLQREAEDRDLAAYEDMIYGGGDR